MQLKDLTIAVPKEIMHGERRVAVTPQTVKKMVDAGATVLIESGAGDGAFFSDDDFSQAGANILSDTFELFQQADILLKVKEPRFNDQLGKHEVEMLRDNTTFVSFLHPAHHLNHDMVKLLAQRNIISFTLDGIPRISRAQQMDCLTTMSTVAGYKAVIFAAYHLPRFIPMMPSALGVIQPAEFIVIGAGVAGLQAIATAKRLGAKVKVLDIRPEAQEQARSLGAELIPFDVPKDLAVGEGGYARRLPAEWYTKEREVLQPYLQACDAVILTALIPGEEAPILVTGPMVESMRCGSVIVDIAVDQGGNCELTSCGENVCHGGVNIIGMANIPATLAVDATSMFAQNAWHFISYLYKEGRLDKNREDEIIGKTLVTLDGEIVHEGTKLAMGLI